MKLTKTTLLTTALFSLMFAGQTAIAGEESPRDEYSIGIIYSVDVTHANDSATRVNFSMSENVTNKNSELFPDPEQ